MATKIISVEQRFELLSKLGANVDWDLLDSGGIQQIIDQPGNPGQQLTVFLRNGGRVTLGDLKIATAPFDPVKFIGENWSLIAGEHDSRNDGITEVDFSKVDFVTCLAKGESAITGEEKLKRLKAGSQIRFGAGVFAGLWRNYQARKENSVLETLFRTKNITYIDFFGDVLLDPNGRRFVLYLYSGGDGRWVWRYDRLDFDRYVKFWSAVSSQVSA